MQFITFVLNQVNISFALIIGSCLLFCSEIGCARPYSPVWKDKKYQNIAWHKKHRRESLAVSAASFPAHCADYDPALCPRHNCSDKWPKSTQCNACSITVCSVKTPVKAGQTLVEHTFLFDPFLFDTLCCCLRELIHCVLLLWSSQSQAVTHRVNTWFHCSNRVTQFQQNSSQSCLYSSWADTLVLDFGQTMILNAIWMNVWSSHISREGNKQLRNWHCRSYYFIIKLDIYLNIIAPRLQGEIYTMHRSSFMGFYCYWPWFYFTRERQIVPHWFENVAKKKKGLFSVKFFTWDSLGALRKRSGIAVELQREINLCICCSFAAVRKTLLECL